LIKINAESLKDFQICSLLYQYKYIDKLDDNKNIRERRIQKFDDTIKRVAAFFFYKKQSYAEPSYQAMLNRWQKLWFADETSAADIAAMKNEIIWGSDTSYTTQAASAMLSFHEQFYDKTSDQVMLVDEPFTVPLSKKVALTGNFDLVLREKKPDGNYKYKIYKWITNNLKKPSSFWTFDFVVLDYAFKYRNNNNLLDISYYLWDFGSSNPGSKEVVLDSEDFSILEHWSSQLEQTEIFSPRRGLTSYCKSCPYDKPCSRWTITDAISK
jgi:hypothetical protein